MAIDAKTTLARVSACLLLGGAITAEAAVAEPAIQEQPSNVQRAQIVQTEWTGESARVVVEHRHGLAWVTEADDATGDVLVEPAGDGTWSARWQPTYYSPSGTYRIRLEGDDFAVTSDTFEVRPCSSCVVPGGIRARWHNRRFRVSVAAQYTPAPAGGFLALPTRVTTGRPLVRVYRDGRRIGSVLLRYRDGRFRGVWPGPRGPRGSIVFHLVSLTDGFANG